jgi:hypothetical protein
MAGWPLLRLLFGKIALELNGLLCLTARGHKCRDSDSSSWWKGARSARAGSHQHKLLDEAGRTFHRVGPAHLLHNGLVRKKR